MYLTAFETTFIENMLKENIHPFHSPSLFDRCYRISLKHTKNKQIVYTFVLLFFFIESSDNYLFQQGSLFDGLMRQSS